MKGLISYRTERSEVYRNRVKRGYIAFAQRIYRLTKKREDILAIKPIVLSFCLYKGLGFILVYVIKGLPWRLSGNESAGKRRRPWV